MRGIGRPRWRAALVRILLLDAEDSPWDGAWAQERWDLVVDLGWAGPYVYDEWRRRLGCRVVSLHDYSSGIGDVRRVAALIEEGRGQVVDREGLDWWQMGSLLVHGSLQLLLAVSRLAKDLPEEASLSVTRPGTVAAALGHLRGRAVDAPSTGRLTTLWARLRRYAGAIDLGPSRVVDIAFDKWDPDYRLRRRFARRPEAPDGPLVLLPSAYVNVSRTVLAYARTLPDRGFLLVATRRGGLVSDLPANVGVASLAAYAPESDPGDTDEVVQAWTAFRREFLRSADLATLADSLGMFDRLTDFVRHGCRIREAWKNVLDREPVTAVLCGDDSNPQTRIPLVLAAKRGLRTLSCHHGALDGRMLLKRQVADTYLAKGEMEADYLVRECCVPPGRITVGAPEEHHWQRKQFTADRAVKRILFFSEPYESYSGRTRELYGEVLPPLCDLARRFGARVLVKLHPFESKPQRKRLIDDVLSSAADRDVVDVVDLRMSDEILAEAWFGITVQSSVAVDCLVVGIPSFLCAWIESDPFDYARQYARYGAGKLLHSPAEIATIPERIDETHSPTRGAIERVWRCIRPLDLDRLLFTRPMGSLEAAVPKAAP